MIRSSKIIHAVMLAACFLSLALSYVSMTRQSGANPHVTLQQRMELENYVLVTNLISPTLGQQPTVNAHPSITSYGLPGLLPMALGFAVAGMPGVVIADFLILAANYALWFLIFFELSNRRFFSASLAAFLCCGGLIPVLELAPEASRAVYNALRPFSLPLVGLTALLSLTAAFARFRPCLLIFIIGILLLAALSHFQNGEFWYVRHPPRPYVTSLFTSLWFLAALKVFGRPSNGWILAGWAAAGLTMQADVYAFPAYGLAWLWIVARSFPAHKKTHLLGIGLFVLIASVFLTQRIWENPAVPPRLGMDALSGGWTAYVPGVGLLIPLALGLCMVLMLRCATDSPLAVGYLVLAGWTLTPFLIKLTLGKAPQMWHYSWLIPAAFTWFACLGGSALLSASRPAVSHLMTGFLFIGILTVLAHQALSLPKPAPSNLLAQINSVPPKRFATLDPYLSALWSAGHGEALLPFSVLSPLSDAEQASRTAWFLRECQLPEDRVARYVNDQKSRRVYFFLGSYGRAGLKPEPGSDPADYPPYGVALSESDVADLRARMKVAPNYPVDLIALNRSDLESGLRPNGNWSPVFRNDQYTLFTRATRHD